MGVAETSENATQTLSKVLELKARLEMELHDTFGKRASKAGKLLHYLFKRPNVHVKQVAQIIGGSYKTANDLVMEFVKAGILVEMTGQTRNRIFVFQAYVDLF